MQTSVTPMSVPVDEPNQAETWPERPRSNTPDAVTNPGPREIPRRSTPITHPVLSEVAP